MGQLCSYWSIGSVAIANLGCCMCTLLRKLLQAPLSRAVCVILFYWRKLESCRVMYFHAHLCSQLGSDFAETGPPVVRLAAHESTFICRKTAAPTELVVRCRTAGYLYLLLTHTLPFTDPIVDPVHTDSHYPRRCARLVRRVRSLDRCRLQQSPRYSDDLANTTFYQVSLVACTRRIWAKRPVSSI